MKSYRRVNTPSTPPTSLFPPTSPPSLIKHINYVNVRGHLEQHPGREDSGMESVGEHHIRRVEGSAQGGGRGVV